jgi:hypothetical protein
MQLLVYFYSYFGDLKLIANSIIKQKEYAITLLKLNYMCNTLKQSKVIPVTGSRGLRVVRS